MWHQVETKDSTDHRVTDSEKRQQDSGNIDSGFLSSGNILLSSSELTDELDCSQVFQSKEVIEESKLIKNDIVTDRYMRTSDSGLDLGISESLSMMNLSHVNMNALGENKEKPVEQNIQPEPILEPVGSKVDSNRLGMTNEQINEALEPWQLYYLQDEDGDTQLHIAIIQGFLEAAAFSLIKMAPHPRLLDIINDDGQAPLHLAVLTQQTRIVRRLILGGANPALRDRRGNTALHLACTMGDLSAARALTDPLATIERNHLGPHKRIPALPQNLEQRNYRGEMCLHIAATRDHVELVRLLLRLGADLEAREGLSGRTALHLAIELRCTSVLAFLLQECRPCLDATNYAGISAYQIAICIDRKLAEELVKLGATPEPLPESDTDMSDDDSIDEDTNTFVPEIARLQQRVGVSASS